jgi:hypothetical protein
MDPDTCKSLIENQCELNNGQIFFIMLSFIPTAIFLPIWVVATCIYAPWLKAQEKRALLEDEHIEIPYHEKYNLQKANNDNLHILDCDKNYVMETTPDGLVFMKYNKKDEGFDYWADKDIKFKFLEVVARKYVTFYNCKDFYINQGQHMRDKLKKIKSEIEDNKRAIEIESKKTEEEKAKDQENAEDNVFANLKSNKQTTGGLNLKTQITRDDFVPDIGTKFMKKGKLADSVLQKKTKSNESKISFSDWKSGFWGLQTSMIPQ